MFSDEQRHRNLLTTLSQRTQERLTTRSEYEQAFDFPPQTSMTPLPVSPGSGGGAAGSLIYGHFLSNATNLLAYSGAEPHAMVKRDSHGGSSCPPSVGFSTFGFLSSLRRVLHRVCVVVIIWFLITVYR